MERHVEGEPKGRRGQGEVSQEHSRGCFPDNGSISNK